MFKILNSGIPSHRSSFTFGKLGRTPIQSLLEQVSRSLQLLASIAVDELGEVRVPDVIHIRPPEECDAALVCLKQSRDIE